MTELIDLISMAFERGCGVKLDSVMRSSRYRVAKNRYRNAPGVYASQGEANTVALGLWEFCSAVNTVGLATARHIQPNTLAQHPPPEAMALIDVLGQKLIKTSSTKLPPEFAQVAYDWQTLDSREQKAALIKLAKTFLRYFRRKDWTERKEPSFVIKGPEVKVWLKDKSWYFKDEMKFKLEETAGGPVLKVWENVDDEPDCTYKYDPMDSLPLGFSADGIFPNCLGSAMLLCGFAELTGAKYQVFSYLQHRSTLPELYTIVFAQMYVNNMIDLDLPRSEAACTKALAEFPRHIEVWAKNQLADFHYGLVIQLADSSWVLMDPLQKNVATLSQAYGIDEAVTILEQYRYIYPGMSLICDDAGKLEAELENVGELGAEAQRRCASILKPLRLDVVSPARASDLQNAQLDDLSLGKDRTPYELADFLELLEETDDALWIEQLLRMLPELAKIDLDRSLLSEMLDLRTDPLNKLIDRLGIDFFNRHESTIWESLNQSGYEDYEEETYTSLLIKLQSLVLPVIDDLTKIVLDEVWGGFTYPHPVIEVMNSGFGLALALLNQLRCWTVNDLDGTVFLSYGGSQQLWHEAVTAENRNSVLLARIEYLVRMLPHHYPTVRNKLDYFERNQVNHGSECQGKGHHSNDGSNQSVA